MNQIARINWKRGQYSDVFRSAIVDPSPLKEGQKVRVVWGKGKKEYSATINCYPLIEEEPLDNGQPQQRQAKAKRKIFTDAAQSPEPAKKARKAVKGTETSGKSKDKPKGNIVSIASPNRKPEIVEESSSDSDLSEDEFPLSDLIPAQQAPQSAQKSSIEGLIDRAIHTLDKTNTVPQNDYHEAVTELRLLRTIAERLECSFASQEAKLDRVLTMMTSNPPQQPSKLQQPSRQPQFSTPDLNCHRQTSLELPFTPPQGANSHPDAVSFSFTSSLADPDSVLDHFDDFMRHSQQDLTDTVPIGGSSQVRLPKEDYAHVKSAGKPTAMALRLVDRRFSKETLMKSTVHGTKEFAVLDGIVIAAIKAEVTSAFSYMCRNTEDMTKMWEGCKISIGKRCQNLRKNTRQE